jgi:hypothetical protein
MSASSSQLNGTMSEKSVQVARKNPAIVFEMAIFFIKLEALASSMTHCYIEDVSCRSNF